ncbi:hypothetical protein ACWCPQ_00945 [Nocardia sp. NPDC001965]
MSPTTVDVDPQVYYDAATALGAAALGFGRAVDNRWSALADCEEMAGSYDDAKAWAADYDARANEAVDTAMLLAEAARGYAILLGEMGYNHAMADWASVIGNTAPEPARIPDPDWISMVNRPDLPSAGGPGNGLVAEGLSGAVDLLDKIGVVIPVGEIATAVGQEQRPGPAPGDQPGKQPRGSGLPVDDVAGAALAGDGRAPVHGIEIGDVESEDLLHAGRGLVQHRPQHPLPQRSIPAQQLAHLGRGHGLAVVRRRRTRPQPDHRIGAQPLLLVPIRTRRRQCRQPQIERLG